MIKEKEGYWTPLEKRWRDWFFAKIGLTRLLGFIPYAANILTITGFGILFWAITDFVYFRNSISRQVWFLVAAWLTDLFDGPTARNNKNVTAFGTFADHTRDLLIILWMIYLCFNVTALLDNLTALIMYSVLTLTTVGMLGIAFGIWLYQREKRRERPEQQYFSFIQEFLLKDLITTVGARIHTTLTALGVIFYLTGAIWKNNFYFNIGAIILIIQILSLGFYLHEVFEAQYEDRAYRIRRGLEKRIKKLEELLKRRKEKG